LFKNLIIPFVQLPVASGGFKGAVGAAAPLLIGSFVFQKAAFSV